MTGPLRPFDPREKLILLSLMRAELKGWRAVRNTLRAMPDNVAMTQAERSAVRVDLERVTIRCASLKAAANNLKQRIRRFQND